jgi:hypothetical protein
LSSGKRARIKDGISVNRNGFRIVYLAEMQLSGVEIIECATRYSYARVTPAQAQAPRAQRPLPPTRLVPR